ncbi:SCP2 sterol-binding domain-containing protein [Polycladidibacter stylochi]|uniref:SCP2 sterol-binding domain-containing protein n=1 Tax=Polycladidibacter stylochi TaxID=1807766 RepID=UPI000836ECA6|nr:SCP2 sterol-binding domain-containing protein [Pseudovibrio stylochi]
MSLEAIQSGIQSRVEAAGFDSTIKFDCGDDGVLVIDGNAVTTNDQEAECTIELSKEDLEALVSGDLNPTAAFMQGKLKVTGDMSLAMKLSQLL